jgi:hypothetical protein
VANFNAAVLFLFRSKERTKQKAVDGPNPVLKRAKQKQLDRSGGSLTSAGLAALT